MAEKENQHYVPKFYLREFSFEGNGKQIGIFNLENNLFHRTAKLKTQGSKKNYYGKDLKVENDLAELERMLAPAIQQVIQTEKLPDRNTENHFCLLTFIVLSDLRTTVHEKSANESADKMIKIAYRKHPDIKDEIDDFSIQFTNSSVLGITLIGDVLPITLDLGYKLLINDTNVPFITSDNPVIKYNIHLEQRKIHGGIVGLGTIGLMIFLPISPDHMLMFFDKDSYSVGMIRKDSFVIRQESVINDLNLLPFLNCDNTVFFDDQVDENYIRSLHTKSQSYTRANQVIVTEHPVVDRLGNVSKDSILHSRETECRTKLHLPFIRTLPKAKKYKPTSMDHMRAYPKNLIKSGALGPRFNTPASFNLPH